MGLVWAIAAIFAFLLAKAAVKALMKQAAMRKPMSVTVKLNGAIIVQRTMRLGTMGNEEKIIEVIGQAIDNSPLAGATMIGELKDEKVGKLGHRSTVQVRKDGSEAQFILEMFPAVV